MKKLQGTDGMMHEKDPATDALVQRGVAEKEKIVYTGFIAQEVEGVAKKLNYEFSGIDKPQDKNGLYGLRYAEFVVPLVKTVQELSKMNDEKDKKINALEERIVKLKAVILQPVAVSRNKE